MAGDRSPNCCNSDPLPNNPAHCVFVSAHLSRCNLNCLGHVSYAIPVITSPYSLSVLSESGLQVPLCLTYVHLITAIAGDLVHYRSLLLVWYLLLHVDEKLPHGVGWLEDIALIPSGAQTFSIFSLSWRMYIRQSTICSSVVDFWGSSSEGG